jgi:hypothetical protein
MRNTFKLLLVILAMFSVSIAAQEDNPELVKKEVQESVAHLKEGAWRIESGVYEIVSTGAGFVWNRVPNRKELFYDVAVCAVVEQILRSGGLNLGNNKPAAKTIVRNLAKVPAGLAKFFDQVEVAGTGMKFGRANVLSQIVKPFVQGGSIVALQQIGFDPIRASELSNYPGDTVARAIVLVGNDRQKANSTAGLTEYFLENLNPSWAIRPLTQVPPKNWVVGQLSDYYAAYAVGDFLSKVVYASANAMLGAKMTERGGILGNAAQWGGYKYYVVGLPIATTTSLSALATAQFMATAVLATPARVVQDAFDAVYDPVVAYAMQIVDAVGRPTVNVVIVIATTGYLRRVYNGWNK